MDIVVLDGVEYIKASVAAKRFKYTSDYIGQLCRSKKIDARLVGRTWFVNPDSVVEHKNAKHGNEVSDTKPAHQVKSKTPSSSYEVAINIKPHHSIVHAPLKNKTIKVTEDRKAHQAESRLVAISYAKDDRSLLPSIKVNKTVVPPKPPKFVKVQLAQSKRLKIGMGSKKQTSFTPSELPDVALSGKVAVSEYKTEVAVEKPKPVSVPVVPVTAPKVITSQEVAKKTAPAPKPVAVAAKSPSFAPVVMQNAIQHTPPNQLLLLSPLIATLLASLVAILVFSASSLVIVNSEETISKTAIEIADFLRLFRL